MATETQKLTPAQRIQIFIQGTRQNLQALSTVTKTSWTDQISFTLPKARLLSNIMLRVEAEYKITNTSSSALSTTELKTKSFDEFGRILSRIQLDLNNGFSPFQCSGKELIEYNKLRGNNSHTKPLDSSMFNNINISADSITANTGTGTVKINMMLELPITLNDREPIGMFLLQNAETSVTVNIDMANPNLASLWGSSLAPYMSMTTMKIVPTIETFSVPYNGNGLPDLSVLKLVQSRTEQVQTGQNIIKLNCGTIYRKIVILAEDGFDLKNISSELELVFNQADINYRVEVPTMQAMNQKHYGLDKPLNGVVFDFTSWSGTPNYSTTRDYVDTEKLTEFWLRFNSSSANGKIVILTETIARLH